MLGAGFIAAAALIPLVLGCIHLYYAYGTRMFSPRGNEGLEQQLKEVPMRLTDQTTFWRAWTGFHASHSLGLIFYGAVYIYLALAQPALLFGSVFLLALGALVLLAYAVLARCYWFRVPLLGVGLALALYILGIIVKTA